jgi:hypothetical protein
LGLEKNPDGSVIGNPVVRAPLTAMPAFPLAAGAIAPLRATAEKQGLDDFSSLWAG